MSKSDSAAISRINRLLERDLYIEWVHREFNRFGQPPERLARAPQSAKSLQMERFELGYAAVNKRMNLVGWKLLPYKVDWDE